jgi:hypothetical protein
MKSKAAKIRELVMQELPPKDIAAKLKVPVSTVYTTRWKLKKTKPTTQVKASSPAIKAKAKEINRHNELLDYLMKEMQETNKLISDAEAIRTYLAVRLKEAFKARAEAAERA